MSERPLRIGIFVSLAGRQAGGIESYEHNLVRALAKVDQTNEYHVFCTDQAAADSFGITQANVHFHARQRWISIPLSLPLQVRAARCDLLHSTYVPPLWSTVPTVFTIHDMSVFDHPEFYHFRHRMVLKALQRHGGKNASHSVCDSNTTRERAIAWLGIDEARTRVVYLGVEDRFHPIPREQARAFIAEKYQVTEPYVLYTGQLRSLHKNLFGLLEAYALFRQQVSTPTKLLLVGKRSWTTSELDETIERLDLADDVIETGHVPDADLPSLYAAAHLFVFPTLSEGFGLSICEAMASGTPVITSNVSCVPEVVADGACLVDPRSPAAIAKAMIDLDENAGLRTALRDRGIARAGTFKWETTAREMISTYHHVLAHRDS